MKKHSTPASITYKRNFTSKIGLIKHVSIIAFSNGDIGEYVSGEESQKEFVIGLPCHYMLYEKSGHLPDIKLVNAPTEISSEKLPMRSPVYLENISSLATSAMKSTIALVNHDKIDLTELEATSDRIHSQMLNLVRRSSTIIFPPEVVSTPSRIRTL